MRGSMLLGPLALLLSCGVDPAKISGHKLYADDGQTIEVDGPVRFAVVGNTRPTAPQLDKPAGQSDHGDAVLTDVINDIRARSGVEGGVHFLVHTGDAVASSTNSDWARFDSDFKGLLDGATLPPDKVPRLAAVAVAGDREAAGDPRYEGMAGAWPEVGATIGYNRVGSWYAFDVETNGVTWRFMVLDSGKEKLGSRWNEQWQWIPRAVKGRYDGLIVLMHNPVLDLAGKKLAMNKEGAPLELVERVEESIDMLKLRAVITAGGHANQIIVPDGPYGTLHLGAGGSGGVGADLRRWGPATEAGRKEDVRLEPLFDMALLSALDGYARRAALPETVVDQAKARDSFEGFTGTFAGSDYPIQGWWMVTLDGSSAEVLFRHREPDGAQSDRYRIRYVDKQGWQAVR